MVSPERPTAHDGSPLELGEILVLLAHDLKNPLAAVLTNLGFVQSSLPRDGENDDAAEALIDARLACESLQRIVSNLEILARDLAQRMTRASIPSDVAPLDLASAADEVVDRQQEASASRRLTLRIVHAEHCYTRADRELVLRVIDNLVANAVQHAKVGSTIDIEVRRHPPSEISLAVIDEGPVVPESLRAEILTAFGQARSKGRSDARYGRGLALYIASIAANATGGRLLIGSRGVQSALTLILPEHEERSSGSWVSSAPSSSRVPNG
ncbi:MAG: hypothetical protein NVSMB1_14840 [Polyangiales bacterium]